MTRNRAYWTAVRQIETELRTKPYDVALYCLLEIEKKLEESIAAGNADEIRANNIVSDAVDRVMWDHLKRELLPKSTIADRIAYIRNSDEQISMDAVHRLSFKVIESNLDELFPEAADKALDTFDDAYPNDISGENWNRHYADTIAAAAGIEVPR